MVVCRFQTRGSKWRIYPFLTRDRLRRIVCCVQEIVSEGFERIRSDTDRPSVRHPATSRITRITRNTRRNESTTRNPTSSNLTVLEIASVQLLPNHLASVRSLPTCASSILPYAWRSIVGETSNRREPSTRSIPIPKLPTDRRGSEGRDRLGALAKRSGGGRTRNESETGEHLDGSAIALCGSQPRRRFISRQDSTHLRPCLSPSGSSRKAHRSSARSIPSSSLEPCRFLYDATARRSVRSFPSFREGKVWTREGARILADVPIAYDERPSCNPTHSSCPFGETDGQPPVGHEGSVAAVERLLERMKRDAFWPRQSERKSEESLYHAFDTLKEWWVGNPSDGTTASMKKLSRTSGDGLGWSWKRLPGGKTMLTHNSIAKGRLRCRSDAIGNSSRIDELRTSVSGRNKKGTVSMKVEGASDCCGMHRISAESTISHNDFHYDLSFQLGKTLFEGLFGGLASKQRLSSNSDIIIRWFNDEGAVQDFLLETKHRLSTRSTLSFQVTSSWHRDVYIEHRFHNMVEYRKSLGSKIFRDGSSSDSSPYWALQILFQGKLFSELRAECRWGNAAAHP